MKQFALILTLSFALFYSATSWGEGDAWRFGLGASYSLTSRITFNSASVTDTNTNASVAAIGEVDLKNVFSVEIDARKTPKDSWGFLGGFTYDLPRQAESVKLKVGDLIFGGSGSGEQLKMMVLHGSAVYRWNAFYLPFGFNYNHISLSGENPAKGGVGAQLGVGYYLNEASVFELMSRATMVKFSPQTSGSTITNLGSGYLSNLMLTGKYIF